MGGHNSGRYRTRTRGTVDAAIRLDIRRLRRQGFLVPGAVTSGTQRWTWTATGEETGSVAVTVNLMDRTRGAMTVRCQVGGEPFVQTIDIVSAPMRFGGLRYYFVCPRLHTRCEVMPFVGRLIASREAQRLAYQSQSEDWLGRSRDRVQRLEKRLWPASGRSRPRGANRARLVDALIEAESAFEEGFAEMAMRRFGRTF